MRNRLLFCPSSCLTPAASLRRGAALVLALSLTACGGGSPDQKARDSVESVRSWTATMRLAATSWLAGKVPSVYAENTFEKARETLGSELETLRKQGVPPVLRPELGRLYAPAASAERLRGAVARGDRVAVRQELGSLAIDDAGLEALERRLPGAGR